MPRLLDWLAVDQRRPFPFDLKHPNFHSLQNGLTWGVGLA